MVKKKEKQKGFNNIINENIKSIFNEIPIPIEIYDPVGFLIYSNNAFLKIFRVPSEDIYLYKYNILQDKSWNRFGLVKEINGAFKGELSNIPNIALNMEKFREEFGTFSVGKTVFNLTMFPVYNSKGEIDYVISFWENITQIKETERQLNILTTALESAANGVLITDNKGTIIWNNHAFMVLTGYSKNELIGKNPRVLKSGLQDNEFYQVLWDTILKGKTWRGEMVNRKKDGSLYTEFQTITPVKNSKGEIENFIAIKIDISERIKSENDLQKLNHALATISACNSVLIHSINEKDLLGDICRVIIKTGGYRFTFIGMIDDRDLETIYIAAKDGFEDNYLKVNEYSPKHQTKDISPLYKAIYDKKIQVINDIESNKYFSYWKDEALKRNYLSVIVLPLIFNEKVLGVLSIYSDVKDFFDLTEIDLLKELADDLSYGINFLRAEEKRKLAEKNLIESEKRYRQFFQQDVAGDYISTPTGKIIDCNSRFLKIFGLKSFEEAKQTNAGNFYFDPKDRKSFLVELKDRKMLINHERKLKSIDGKTVYVIENVWGNFDDAGNLIQIEGFLFDITQRKIAERELKESELKYQELVENINDVVFTTDLNGIINYISPAIELLSGYKPDELIGKNFTNYIYEPDRPKTVSKSNNPLKEYSNPNEYRIITKTGGNKWIHISSKPMKRNGKTIGIQGIFFDVTQIKDTELKLEEAKEKAEESDKLKSAFLAQMSHEIRTPLNVILSYNGLIREELQNKMSGDWNDIFDSTEMAGRRLLRTIDLILNMSMVQTGHIEVNKNLFNLENLIENLYIEFKSLAEKKKIDLEFVNNIGSTIIESDEYILSRIVENLIDNAVKYTNKGKVEIILYNVNKKGLCIDVSDSGIGISKEYLPYLFSPFSQEDIGYSRKFEGNGLGLALVKHYADLLDVELKVESEKGSGTTFTVILKK